MKLIIILCLVLFPALSYSKGMNGKYFITGIAYDENNKPLTNAVIELQFKKQTIFVRTDAAGKYKLTVEWGTACPNHLTRSEQRRLTKDSNPTWLNLTYNSKTIKIKNTWRRYTWTSSKEESRLTRSKDLRFV